MRYLLYMRVSEHQWIWAGLWLTSLLFVFAIGRSFPAGSTTEEIAPVEPIAAAPRAATEDVPLHIARRRALAPAAPVSLPSTAPEPVRPTRTLESILSEKDPVQRRIGFALALDGMDAQGVKEAIALYDGLPGRNDLRDERRVLLYRWGQLDGEEALFYAGSIEDDRTRTDSMNKALSGWASSDPDAALVWAQDNFDGEDNPYLVPVISSVANKDLYRATDLTYLLPYGRNRGSAVGSLVDGFMQQSPEAAMDWARALPDGVLKQGISARVADRLARDDPAFNAYFPSTLIESEASRRAYESYAKAWGRSDPVEAAAWVDANVPNEFRGGAAAGVLYGFMRRDVVAATDWVSTQSPSPVLDAAISRSADRLRRGNPEQAIDLALNIGDEEKRNQSITSIAEYWQRHDPEAAAEFFNP